jgi:acyl-CoA synthetase (AMP-forming)/AMP-acid ligase II
VKACVVKKPDTEISEGDLKTFCRKHLGRSWFPTASVFMTNCPKTRREKSSKPNSEKTENEDDEKFLSGQILVKGWRTFPPDVLEVL